VDKFINEIFNFIELIIWILLNQQFLFYLNQQSILKIFK